MTDNDVFEQFREWSVSVVRQVFWRSSYLDDAVQAGMFGLWIAAKKWDRKNNFKTFAWKYVRGAAIDSFRAWSVRGKQTTSLDVLMADNQKQFEPEAPAKIDLDFLELLGQEAKQVVTLYYLEGLNQKEIADKMGFSESKVSVIRNEAIQYLRQRLR